MKICLVGYGAMGHVVADSISSDDIISGIVAPGYNENFEGIESDVIIDFRIIQIFLKFMNMLKNI